MTTFEIALIISTFLCSLVAGFLFAYAVVVMPGIKNLDDKAFIEVFQVTDRIIQNNQPLFILLWIGSLVAVIIATALGVSHLEGVDLYGLILAVSLYVTGVQAITIVVNLPLNNQLQKIDASALDSQQLKAARDLFESRWNAANVIRTAVACGVSLMLILLLFRL